MNRSGLKSDFHLKSEWKKKKKKKKKQLGSCSAHLIHNERLQGGCSTGYSPNMLHGYILNQQGFEDWKEGGGRVCFSLSQFNNELRLSGPGQPWGDPSEKD